MINQKSLIILFPSTNYAYRAELLFVNAQLYCKLIPVPKQLSCNCGLCIRINKSDEDKALQILRSKYVDIESIHDM